MRKPRARSSFSLDSTEYAGRFAGSGYSAVVIGTTRGATKAGSERARMAKISRAKSNQLVSPPALAC